jgi:hypothetical protein
LFELRSSNNGGSPITPLTLVSILPNQREKRRKNGKEKKPINFFYGLILPKANVENGRIM